MLDLNDNFRKFAQSVSRFIGSGWALLLVAGVICGTGYYWDFSDRWKLNASLGGTLLTLILLVFLQGSQNHSDRATHLKLDELVRTTEGARDELTAAERQADKDIDELDNSM